MATETKKNTKSETNGTKVSGPHVAEAPQLRSDGASLGTARGGRELQGVIVKKSGDKTVAVEVTRIARHELYHRKVVKSKKYLVHDEENAGKVGQQVKIREMRPKSAKKRFVLVK